MITFRSLKVLVSDEIKTAVELPRKSWSNFKPSLFPTTYLQFEFLLESYGCDTTVK